MHRLAEEVRDALEVLRKRVPTATVPGAAPAVKADAPGEHGIARMKRWLFQGGPPNP